MEHRPGHLELIQAFHSDGRMEIAGAVGDPPSYGLLVFRDVESAEAFAPTIPTWPLGWSRAGRSSPGPS